MKKTIRTSLLSAAAAISNIRGKRQVGWRKEGGSSSIWTTAGTSNVGVWLTPWGRDETARAPWAEVEESDPGGKPQESKVYTEETVKDKPTGRQRAQNKLSGAQRIYLFKREDVKSTDSILLNSAKVKDKATAKWNEHLACMHELIALRSGLCMWCDLQPQVPATPVSLPEGL